MQIYAAENKVPLYKRAEDIRKRKAMEKEKLQKDLEKKKEEKDPMPSFKPDLTLTQKKLPNRENEYFLQYKKFFFY